jgi:hypothetical protein
MNLLGNNVDTIKKNTQTLIDASKEVGLEVNTEKTKYMLVSHHQNARRYHDIFYSFILTFINVVTQLYFLFQNIQFILFV